MLYRDIHTPRDLLPAASWPRDRVGAESLSGGKHCDVAFLRGDGEVFGGGPVGRSLHKTAYGDPRKLFSEKKMATLRNDAIIV